MSITGHPAFRARFRVDAGLARRVAVDAVDVYARGAIDRIAHRIEVEFPVTPCSGLKYRHELDAGRFGENIDRPCRALDIEPVWW